MDAQKQMLLAANLKWLAAVAKAAAENAPYTPTSHRDDVRAQLNGTWEKIVADRRERFKNRINELLKEKK